MKTYPQIPEMASTSRFKGPVGGTMMPAGTYSRLNLKSWEGPGPQGRGEKADLTKQMNASDPIRESGTGQAVQCNALTSVERVRRDGVMSVKPGSGEGFSLFFFFAFQPHQSFN